MVFVRKINGYYVLAHAVRKGNRILQKTKYLGRKLPPKIRLEQLKKEFLGELGGARYKYLPLQDLLQIEEKRKAYTKDLARLSSTEKKKQLSQFMIRYTYNSSKLSGVNVTLRQTYLILKDGIVPKNFKSLRTVKEIENHEKGVVAITQYKGKLNLAFIKKLHKILFAGVDDSIAGELRSALRRNVKIGGTPYVPPSWERIDKELDSFFSWYHAENRALHPLELAALIHLKLISLQPFADGNSRLSRLLMNWVLWKKGYPMIDIPVEDIEQYYNLLDLYQIEHKEKPFVEYIVRKYLEIE